MASVCLPRKLDRLCIRLKHNRHLTTSQAQMRFAPSFDPYSYTQGRWLDRDTERREARRLHFNFDALLNLAVRSSAGARRVTDCEKKEGGFNRVFIIHLDNGAKVVARLPTRLAGPSGLTVSSEVATMEFVRENTQVPVPKVLAWSADKDVGPVGSEYIIMEAVPGVPLMGVWGRMTGLQHIECIESLGKIAKDLCRLEFPAFGSLYFDATNAQMDAVPVGSKYCIGPLCAPQHWEGIIERSSMTGAVTSRRGPWRNLTAYFSDLIDIAKSNASRCSASEKHHHEILDVYLGAVKSAASADFVQDCSKPILFHPDFHTRNIFVASDDPTKITAIIDWQSTSIQPAFVPAAETPDFAETIPFDRVLDAHRDAETEDAEVDAQRCAGTWAVLARICPKFGEGIALDPRLCRYLAAPGLGWLNDELSVRSLVRDLDQGWEQLELPGESMGRLSKENEDALNEMLEEKESTQRLIMYLARLLRCDMDGWVETGRWEEILPTYRSEYERFLECCIESREEEESEEDALQKAQRSWPYDLR